MLKNQKKGVRSLAVPKKSCKFAAIFVVMRVHDTRNMVMRGAENQNKN
jgi:hypothetical protein